MAGGQGISFAATGPTIVYGHNSSGKSSFDRIFKSVCRSKDDKMSILADVNAAHDIPQSARIDFQIDGKNYHVSIRFKLSPSLEVSVNPSFTEPAGNREPESNIFLPGSKPLVMRLTTRMKRRRRRSDPATQYSFSPSASIDMFFLFQNRYTTHRSYFMFS